MPEWAVTTLELREEQSETMGVADGRQDTGHPHPTHQRDDSPAGEILPS